VALVVAVALAFGFHPTATPIEWLGATGIFALITLALTWVAVAFGLLAKTPEGANSLSLILIVLPFVSSAFVPTGSMPVAVRWFTQNQPFTPLSNVMKSEADTIKNAIGNLR